MVNMAKSEPIPNSRKPWGEIHRDYRMTDADGRRLVMEFVPGHGTCLVPWIGPDRSTPGK